MRSLPCWLEKTPSSMAATRCSRTTSHAQSGWGGTGCATSTPGRAAGAGTAERGWLHCGPHGAGHFVKMVHNAIEYGMMAAYAEGFNLLSHAGAGAEAHDAAADAETTPLRHPEHYRYDFALGDIAELWRRGSVIPSWLLDLTAQSFAQD